MSETMRVTKNDYGINLTYTVRDGNGAVINISAAAGVTTKILHIGRRGEAANLVDGTMSYVTDGVDGQVKYTIAAAALATAGYYDAEIELNYASGRRTTSPFTIQVLEEL